MIAAEPITPGRIIDALRSFGNYGYGGQDAGHSWPLHLDALRRRMLLTEAEKPALQKRLQQMRRQPFLHGVYFAYYPTGWRYDPSAVKDPS